MSSAKQGTKVAPAHERSVHMNTPIPSNYSFVRKGNVYITKHSRELARKAGAIVYQVHNSRNRLQGIRVPTHIWHRVRAMEADTSETRAAAVTRTDISLRGKVQRELEAQFPLVPDESVARILDHALKKHSRRVGRSTKVELSDRVRLAVFAHIRHVHTDYDQLMQRGIERRSARDQVQTIIDAKALEWGGDLAVERKEQNREKRRRQRKRTLRQLVTKVRAETPQPKANSSCQPEVIDLTGSVSPPQSVPVTASTIELP